MSYYLYRLPPKGERLKVRPMTRAAKKVGRQMLVQTTLRTVGRVGTANSDEIAVQDIRIASLDSDL